MNKREYQQRDRNHEEEPNGNSGNEEYNTLFEKFTGGAHPGRIKNQQIKR